MAANTSDKPEKNKNNGRKKKAKGDFEEAKSGSEKKAKHKEDKKNKSRDEDDEEASHNNHNTRERKETIKSSKDDKSDKKSEKERRTGKKNKKNYSDENVLKRTKKHNKKKNKTGIDDDEYGGGKKNAPSSDKKREKSRTEKDTKKDIKKSAKANNKVKVMNAEDGKKKNGEGDNNHKTNKKPNKGKKLDDAEVANGKARKHEVEKSNCAGKTVEDKHPSSEELQKEEPPKESSKESDKSESETSESSEEPPANEFSKSRITSNENQHLFGKSKQASSPGHQVESSPELDTIDSERDDDTSDSDSSDEERSTDDDYLDSQSEYESDEHEDSSVEETKRSVNLGGNKEKSNLTVKMTFSKKDVTVSNSGDGGKLSQPLARPKAEPPSSPRRPKLQFQKLNRPKLPIFEEPPDWLFNPEKKQRNGAFNIRGGVRFDQEKSIPRPITPTGEDNQPPQLKPTVVGGLTKSDEGSVPALDSGRDYFVGKLADKSETPFANKLFGFLHQGPQSYSDEKVIDLVKEHPMTCTVKYEFEALGGRTLYPLSMLCTLDASVMAVRKCYYAHPPAIKEKDIWIGTPLHYACSYRARQDVVQFILQKDPTALEATNEFQRMPLHMKCLNDTDLEQDVVSLLVERCPLAAEKVDKDGNTPLHLACKNHHATVKVLDALVMAFPMACVARSSSGRTPLHLAVAQSGDAALVQSLIEAHPFALEVADNNGDIPLHIAVQVEDNLKTVKLLVENYPRGLNVKNKKGENPLAMARRLGLKDSSVVEMLAPAND